MDFKYDSTRVRLHVGEKLTKVAFDGHDVGVVPHLPVCVRIAVAVDEQRRTIPGDPRKHEQDERPSHPACDHKHSFSDTNFDALSVIIAT
jgi:hypothetical protein